VLGVAGEVALELVQLLQHCLEVADASGDQPAHVGDRLAQRLLVLDQGVGVDDLRRWCDRRAAAVAEAPGWVLASLKWATAKVERASQRGNGDRSSGQERQAERGGDSTTPRRLIECGRSPGLQP
jgi:hypothetical protein